MCSPQRYFDTAGLVREFVDELGPDIVSCHCKDIALRDELTVHLEEVRPGTGGLDYSALLTALDGLETDVPIMLEHLESEAEYERTAVHVRAVATDVGVDVSARGSCLFCLDRSVLDPSSSRHESPRVADPNPTQ